MIELIAITFSGLFISNVLITNLIGLPIFKEKQVSIEPAIKIGLLTTLISVVSMAVIYPLNKVLLDETAYLIPLFSILVVALVSMLVNIVAKKINYSLKENEIFLPMISFNSIIIFVVLLGASQTTFFQSVFYALGSGLGYTLLMLMMVTIKPRLELPGLPKAFKGLPIMLITLGLIALTFMGLAGLF